MKIGYIIAFLFLLQSFATSAQEDDVITDDSDQVESSEGDDVIIENSPPSPIKVQEISEKSDGKTVTLSHKEFRETHQLSIGEEITVWYQRKEKEKPIKLKGTILDGDGRTLVLGDPEDETKREELELKKITAVKVPFKYTVGRRLAGLGKVGIGVAVLGAGAGIVYFSSQYVVLNGPQFVFGVFGSVVGVGVGSIGAYLIGNGSGNVFRGRKCKMDKGWKISIR